MGEVRFLALLDTSVEPLMRLLAQAATGKTTMSHYSFSNQNIYANIYSHHFSENAKPGGRMKSLIGMVSLSAVVTVLTGCASPPEWPSFSECETCSRGNAMKSFALATDYCRKLQDHYEKVSNVSNGTRLGIVAVGTLAGSVAAPISSGNTAKGFAGLSGASNAFQSQFDSSFSSAIALKRGDAVRTAYMKAYDQYRAARTYDEKVEVTMHMATMCAMAAGSAELAALKSVTNAPLNEDLKEPGSGQGDTAQPNPSAK